jgi:hypothetical protein
MRKRIVSMAYLGAWLLMTITASALATDANSSNSTVGNWIMNPTKSHFERI